MIPPCTREDHPDCISGGPPDVMYHRDGTPCRCCHCSEHHEYEEAPLYGDRMKEDGEDES